MRVEPLLLALLLLATPALAEDEAPSLELLEFLGRFETADGQWLDPTELDVPVTVEGAEPRGQEE